MTISEDTSRRGAFGVIVRFGVAAAVAEVAATLIAAQATEVAAPWVIGIACATGVLLIGAGVLVVRTYRPAPGHPGPALRRTRTDRETGGVRRVERMIDTGLNETHRFNLRMRPWLIELAEHRLRRHAAADLKHHPDTARTLLGDSLWQLTQEPVATAPTRAQLAAWIARLEQL